MSFVFTPPPSNPRDTDNGIFLDASNRPGNPYHFLSPYFMVDDPIIPVPGTSLKSRSVEGIWQGLKVISGCTDFSQFTSTPQKRPHQSQRQLDWTYADQIFSYENEPIGLVAARRKIYVPSYRWFFDNIVPEWFKTRFWRLGSTGRKICVFDVDANGDIESTSAALAHSALLVEFLREYDEGGICSQERENLVVLGSLNLDHLVEENQSNLRCGGMGYNSAASLSMLGVKAHLFGVVGDDWHGRVLQEAVENLPDIEASISVTRKEGTGLAEYGLKRGAVRLNRLFLCESRIPVASYVLRSIGQPILAAGAPLSTVGLLKGGRKLFWSPGDVLLNQTDARYWPRASVLFVNEEEWSVYRKENGPYPGYIFVTGHSRGARVVQDERVVAREKSSMIVRGWDIGAGDAFAAAAVAKMLSGESPSEALKAGVEFATSVIRQG